MCVCDGRWAMGVWVGGWPAYVECVSADGEEVGCLVGPPEEGVVEGLLHTDALGGVLVQHQTQQIVQHRRLGQLHTHKPNQISPEGWMCESSRWFPFIADVSEFVWLVVLPHAPDGR